MYNFSSHAKQRARFIIEMKKNNMHVAEFYYQDLAIDIYKTNPDLLNEALGRDNKQYDVFTSQLLMFCEMGNFKYDINKLKSAFCSYAKHAIVELLDELEEESGLHLEFGDFYLDRADYERNRM